MALMAPSCWQTETLYHQHRYPFGIKMDEEKYGENCIYSMVGSAVPLWHENEDAFPSGSHPMLTFPITLTLTQVMLSSTCWAVFYNRSAWQTVVMLRKPTLSIPFWACDWWGGAGNPIFTPTLCSDWWSVPTWESKLFSPIFHTTISAALMWQTSATLWMPCRSNNLHIKPNFK